jgi:hypothetical protein
MISEVSICNQALSWVGAKQIDALDEPTRAAEWCRNNYAFLRDAVLEERNWTFAIDRAVSTVADKDAWNQMYAHPLPLEWLKVFRVYCDVSCPMHPRKSEGWQREGNNVLAQDATVYMYGIKRITDTGAFTNLFVQALAARMAADMAIPFAENRVLQADLWALYQRKLDEATYRDGQQGVNEQERWTGLTDVR